MFGWRRIQHGRSWNLNNAQNLSAEALAQKELLAHKPKLWDLWTADAEAQGSLTEKEKGVAVRSGGWTAIMPLSAKAVPSGDDDTEDPSAKGMAAEPPLQPPPTSLALGLRAVGAVVFDPISRGIENLWRRNRPMRPPSEKTDEPMLQLPRQATLYVEVAILMPSPDYPVYVGSARHEEVDEKKWGRRERNEITDYAIGLYKCPWDM
ncbi:hypothetical protein NLJ89_g12002 [Agrocybe chaxingu]|uniref:Uncharacterized protein n=1 Tax=Agrocybe chaxingu TaxID=84603 RepID=A0A9W8JMQ0_9AGAR|nr:hypothetical protein NLJ89_g12002 [Agrocybe chaxingu]